MTRYGDDTERRENGDVESDAEAEAAPAPGAVKTTGVTPGASPPRRVVSGWGMTETKRGVGSRLRRRYYRFRNRWSDRPLVPPGRVAPPGSKPAREAVPAAPSAARPEVTSPAPPAARPEAAPPAPPAARPEAAPPARFSPLPPVAQDVAPVAVTEAAPASAPAPNRAARAALVGVVGLFAVLSLVVAVRTPPWEANDEPAHVENVQRILENGGYRIEPGAGLSAHQPPLYYASLSVWQRAVGLSIRHPEPRPNPDAINCDPPCNIFRHNIQRDSADQRFVGLLRLPSVLLGVLTVLLAAAIARRLSSDPWTPVVAAAVVAGVPKLVFLSGVVNNDNLSNILGGVLTLLAVIFVMRPPASWRGRTLMVALLGVVMGLLVLTKYSGIPLAVAIAVAITCVGASWEERGKLLGIAAGATLAICGWWLVLNQIRYGDPLAVTASKDHLRGIGGLGFGEADPSLRLAFIDLPRRVWESFWYTSGWNQFHWSFWAYLPFWAGLVAALAGLVAWARQAVSAQKRALLVLGSLAVSAIASVWMVGFQTETVQARIAFMGLPAIGVLAALGLERFRSPVAIRFLLPAIGLIGTLIAIHNDIPGPV